MSNEDIKVTIIADSVNANNNRITTFELEYPRLIHSELMTHRLFSRNAMSSRAIPIQKMIDQVIKSPARPVEWGKNKAGMQADGEHQELIQGYTADEWWNLAALSASRFAQGFADANYHKQVANRLLEPFQRMKTIVTATELYNFFWLRCDSDADPTIKLLAEQMKEAYTNSIPELLKSNEWHTPYVYHEVDQDVFKYYIIENNNKKYLTEEIAIAISSSCCAQVSYRNLNSGYDKAMAIYDKLLSGSKPHCFDKETEVLTKNGWKYWTEINYGDLLADVDFKTLEFNGFKKPLNLIKQSFTGNMYFIDNEKVSMKITEGHRMIGHLVHTATDRYSQFNPSIYNANDSTSKSKKTKGQMESRLPTATINNKDIDPLGELIGFYIGDGFIKNDKIHFHLKKKRKIKYIETIFDKLKLEFHKTLGSDGNTLLYIKDKELSLKIASVCKQGSRNKRVGEWNFPLYRGIFKGLQNSDGSVKRKTWVYSTTSKDLKKDILQIAPLIGYTVNEGKPQKNCFRLFFNTYNYVRINDSRTISSRVEIIPVENEPVFCATMPSGALIVRRKNKVLISGNCSPFEHQAKPMNFTNSMSQFNYSMTLENITQDDTEWEKGITHCDRECNYWSGNFKGWIQHRQLITNHVKMY